MNIFFFRKYVKVYISTIKILYNKTLMRRNWASKASLVFLGLNFQYVKMFLFHR